MIYFSELFLGKPNNNTVFLQRSGEQTFHIETNANFNIELWHGKVSWTSEFWGLNVFLIVLIVII